VTDNWHLPPRPDSAVPPGRSNDRTCGVLGRRDRRTGGRTGIVLVLALLLIGGMSVDGVLSHGRAALASAPLGGAQTFGANSATESATLSAFPGTATTAGDLLVAVIRERNTTALAPVSSVTDSAGNSWVRAASVTRGKHADGEVWYAASAASLASSQAVTVTTGGTSASTSALTFTVLEVTGASASPLDVTATKSGSKQPASTGATVGTAQASEIAIGDIGWNGSVTVSGQTAGYTTTAVEQSTISGSATGEQAAWQLLTATGAETYSATLSSSSAVWTGAIATFRVAASPSSISGTVTDSVTTAAISGATVSYSGSGGGTVTTNGSGVYAVSSLAPGTYTVTASATGYASQSAPVSVTAGVTAKQDFMLAPQPGAISGTVTDSVTHAAVSGATVSYSGAGASGSTTTGADGAYTFSALTEGSYTVSASASGYASQSFPVEVAAGASTTQDFALVARPGTITGKVTDSVTGAAISGATVSYRSASTPTPHVMVIMEENRGYAATLGSCSADPYFCGLASNYASATSWYGVSHPSLPNYLAIDSGSTQGQTTDCTACGPFSATDLGGQLSAAAIPWTAYMESMPSACYTGAGNTSTDPYAKKHDPFVYFSDVLNNGCAQHVLPYPGASNMISALDSASAPSFVWITPNQLDDMHDGSVTAGDTWLQANLGPVLASPWFTGGNATVIVTMDEQTSNNTGCCGDAAGGHIPMVVISNAASGKGALTTAGDHYGTLRTIEEVYGLGYLGAASDPMNGDLLALFGVANNTTTNGSGVYTLSNVAPGTYTVTASDTGYTSGSASVSVAAGATTTQNFALMP
jgi:phosphatidylinositol-3-phosphatase